MSGLNEAEHGWRWHQEEGAKACRAVGRGGDGLPLSVAADRASGEGDEFQAHDFRAGETAGATVEGGGHSPSTGCCSCTQVTPYSEAKTAFRTPPGPPHSGCPEGSMGPDSKFNFFSLPPSRLWAREPTPVISCRQVPSSDPMSQGTKPKTTGRPTVVRPQVYF